MLTKRHLQVFAAGPIDPDGPLPAPLETDPGLNAASSTVPFYPEHVLYVRPNPNGTRKMCGNCLFWKMSDAQCFLHEADIVTMMDMICGYHVFGQPFPGGDGEELTARNMDPVQPETSGLIQVPGGTSCDTCMHYYASAQTVGTCLALQDPNNPGENPVVEPLGCCTRWERKV